MSYENKYLKYRNKYLSLKNFLQIGGSSFNSEIVSEPRKRADIFNEGANPLIFVFDCDYTIWPFDCDGRRENDVRFPYIRRPDGSVFDANGKPANPYPEVPNILGALYDAGIQVTFASRNPSVRQVYQLLNTIPMKSKQPCLTLLDSMRNNYGFLQAYDSGENNKLVHFNKIKEVTKIDFNNMVFFDDNRNNIEHAETLGVISVLLSKQTGLTWDAIDNALGRWRARGYGI